MAKKGPVRLAYNVYEPKDGSNKSLSPVIFLHGVGGNKEMWTSEPQIVADQTKRTAYTLDARDHGDSEYTDDFNFDLNSVDLVHFMDVHRIEKAILIGVSMGGITSIRTALTRPERVEKIMPLDVGVKKLSKEIMDMVSGFISLWLMALENMPSDLDEDGAIDFGLDFMYSKIPPNTALVPPKENMRLIGTTLKRMPNGKYDVRYNTKAILSAVQNYDQIYTEPTGVFEGPALFVYGELSPFNVGKDKENILKLFPKAEFVEFEGCSHAVNIEKPEKFFETMMKFILS